MTLGAWRKAARSPFGIVVEIVSELPLVERCLGLRMHEFDRILQGNNVDWLGFVDLVEHGREGGRLAATGRSCDEDQAGLFLRDLGEDRRQSNGLDRRHGAFQFPQDDREVALLAEDVHAEARFLAEASSCNRRSRR